MNGADGIQGKRNLTTGALSSTEDAGHHGEQKPRVLPTNDDAPLAPGLEHQKVEGRSTSATRVFDAQARAQYLKHEQGKEPMTADAYEALTGIRVDGEEVARLDQKVKDVAQKLGLAHTVGFAVETDYMRIFNYPFLGTFRAGDRPEQPILVGIGLKAKTPEDVELLYKYWNRGALPQKLKPWLEDFLSLDETQRIEAILVHEKHELEAIGWSKRPHHQAIEQSAKTEYDVSPRVRKHLELYARINREVFGAAE